MLLHEIISANEITKNGEQQSILIELLLPYKKSLLTYYKDLFCCDPVLIVTSVSNACQYGFIASANDMSEAVYHYVQDMTDLSEEEKDNESELINFQSVMLSSL